jgi:hypothetical protein
MYKPGEDLSVTLSDTTGQLVYETKNAKFEGKSTGCGGTRYSSTKEFSAVLRMPSSDALQEVVVWGGKQLNSQ